ALVRGEAAREADREDLRVEHLVGRGDLRVRGSLALERALQAPAREAHEAVTQSLLRAPYFVVRDLLHALPDGLVYGVLEPLGLEVALEEARELVGEPRVRVHAVRDVSDRHLALRHGGPDALPH